MAVEIPISAFETVREIATDPAWYTYVLQGLGIGGPAGLAVGVGMYLLKRAVAQKQQPLEGAVPQHAPFPRRLDEARQLVELGEQESRIPVLDALRGMLIDDAIEKIKEQPNADPKQVEILNQLVAQIDNEVDRIAPITTTPED